MSKLPNDLVWWDQMQKERARYGERLVRTWKEMKLHNKLQCLSQGSKSVDDYHKEMEMTMI
ncbi:hypothetical protein CR513_00857, partial [Mucuna pruriens]